MTGVFLSYSHDSEAHREAVVRLAQQLRAWGVDVVLDRFVPAPAEGWPRWMMAQVESADFVLVVCTATYRRRFEGQEAAAKGQGATFEGLLATQHLYDANARNTRFIPIAFEGTSETDIPTVLRPYQRYTLPLDVDAHPETLEDLVRHLTGQPEIVAAPLGPRKILPPRGAPAAPTPTVASATATSLASARTALAPAPVLSVGGADVRVEPIELLHHLLVSLFPTGDGFRQWVSLGPDGDALVAEFPGGNAGASTEIARYLDILRRRDYLDAELFARLRSSFPRRGGDIERAAAIWGTPLAALAIAPRTFHVGDLIGGDQRALPIDVGEQRGGFLGDPVESVRGVTRSTPFEQIYLRVWFPKFKPRTPRFFVDVPIEMCVALGPQRHGAQADPLSEDLLGRLRRLSQIDVWVQCADADVTPCDGTLHLPWPTNVLSFELTPRRPGGLRIVIVLLIHNQPVHRLQREVQVYDRREQGERWS